MRFNYDCIRDVLLYLESNLGYEEDSTILKTLNWQQISNASELSEKYSTDEITHCLELLKDNDFIKVPNFRRLPSGDIYIFDVNDITWNGYDLLDTIKNDTVWQKTKEQLKKVGSSGMNIILSTAIEFGKDFVKEKIGLK